MQIFDNEVFNYDDFYSIVDRVGAIRPEDVKEPGRLLILAELLHQDLTILSRGDRQSLNSYEVLELICRLLRILYTAKEERTPDFNLLLKKVRELEPNEE